MAQFVNKRRNVSPNAVDDLVMLDQIKEERILECLNNRYSIDQIYTSIGPVLIAINPFKMIQGLYTDAKIREYRGKKAFELPPHTYQLADETYFNMINYRENQCVIITGESGSGKTETSKIIMQYISAVSGRSVEVVRVKDRLLSSNPILEGFGNAKTVNNNNSSRFGKYMEILFDYGGDPVGGRVTNYLLEKSRVVGPSQGERNFHIFYQLCNGAGPAEKQQYCLENPQYYYYLSSSQCYTVPGIDDISDYKETMEAFRVMNFSSQEIAEIHRVISIVLWLGNVAFQEDNAEVSSVADLRVLDVVAGLLQVPTPTISAALCTRKIQTGIGNKAEIFTKPNTAAQADFCRDTLAKALYSRLFDFVVAKINLAIKKENFEGLVIGVLDIYGFEIFQSNSFEQLCINFVNEKLQQIFIELTLKAEQEEYAAEGIPWKEIPYNNNKPLCDLIEGKPGLLSICDDCCHTNKTDAMFVNDLRSFFGNNQYIHCGSNDFSIRHYAGDVRYDSNNFLTKNKDTLFDDLVLVMKASPCSFIRDHGWMDIETIEGQKKRPPTVGSMFKDQVASLMKALKASVPHYIRCIKPNHEKTPNNLDKEYVMRQVRYLGLMENVRVRRAGYAHRSVFDRFVKRYGMLSKAVWSGQVYGDPRSLCQSICQSLNWTPNKEYSLGKTKIFIQEAATLFSLEELLERRVNEAVIVIQKSYRKYKRKRDYLEMRADCFDLVNNRKERRRLSVNRDYRGDYLDFNYNKLVVALISQSAQKEKIIFADRANTPILVGKKGFFEKLLGPKEIETSEPRFLLLTDRHLYSFIYDQEIDPRTQQPYGPVKLKLFYQLPILQIASIVTSPYADNYFIIHFTDAAGTRDTLQSCRRKTEFFGCLAKLQREQGRNLDIRFQMQDLIVISREKKREVEIKWIKDDTVDSNSERLVRIKHNVEIRSPSGMPPSMIQAPYRPPKLELSKSPGRPSLKALYDCGGNGVDEIAFKAGDIIYIIKEEVDGWFEGELNGRKGFVPATFVERIKLNAGAGAKKGPGGKPSPWQEMKADDGQVYYYNSITDVSQWEMPEEMKRAMASPKLAPKSMGAGAGAGSKFGGVGASAAPAGGFGGANKFGGGASASSSPSFGAVASPIGGGRTVATTPATGGGKRNSLTGGNCAFAGCSSQRFAGKAYCAVHANAANNSSAPPPPSNASPASPFGANRSLGGGGAGGGGGGGGGAAPFGARNPPSAAVSKFSAQLANRPKDAAPPTGIIGMARPGMPIPGMGAGAASAASPQTANRSIGYGGPAAGGAPGAGPVATPMALPGIGRGGGMGLPGMGAGGGAGRPVIPPKKSNWEQVKDDSSGQFYWYNSVTNESRWDRPADA